MEKVRRENIKNFMRIGIDARFYGPKKQKGLGRYLQELITELEKIDTNNEFVIFLRCENWNDYQPINNNFRKVLADYRWYTFAEQIMMPIKIWREDIDLMHFPHFNIPIFCPTKFVVTIHDLILKHFPTRRASTLGPIMYRIKNWGYEITIWLAVRRSQKIIAVSEFTKRDILNNFNVADNKIKVIYEGVLSPVIPTPFVIPAKAGIQNVDLRFSAKGRTWRGNDKEEGRSNEIYLLYVGNAYPHKNLERLILSFDKLSGDYPDLKLVLVGELDYFYKRLQEYVSGFNPKTTNNIIFTDLVSDNELNNLYKNASLYVFPSEYEGFGLPPLEAMSCGLPVVSSNASCLPEILGNSAIYFNPVSVDDMVDKIKKVFNNRAIRKDLIEKGYQQIKKYNWQKMTKAIRRIYAEEKI
ncbi:MAG: glycosyltransferase family 1 protein [bacterium]